MLTADLLRANIRKGVIKPRLIDPEDDELMRLATELVALFEAHTDGTRGELDEAVDDVVGDETRFAITRGLVKLLNDRSDWQTVAPIDPVDLRRMVFEASAASHPVATRKSRLHTVSRDDVLARVAAALEVDVAAVEEGLYADLKSQQRLVSFRTLTPRALLDRYNLAQAQGLLFRAHELHIDVAVDRPSRLRQLFRWLKFHQLMHRTHRHESGWRITVDGPMSLFEQSQRYGLQMARFLPALLLADQWSLHADVEWPHARDPLRLELGPDDGLVTHYKQRGTWITEEEKVLVSRVDKSKTPWKVSRKARVVDLGGVDVFVPDFTVRCADSGREAFVEVIGYWRRDYLERRAHALATHGPENLVLCVSRNLATDGGAVPDGLADRVLDFAKVIPLNRFLEAVERVAR